jgi:hypothetical protein
MNKMNGDGGHRSISHQRKKLDRRRLAAESRARAAVPERQNREVDCARIFRFACGGGRALATASI